VAFLLGLTSDRVQPLPAEPVANEQPAEAGIVISMGPDIEAAVTAQAAPG
jgi:hypothetical protein